MAPARPSFYVFQPTDAEYLGLIEDHLEGRGIGFTYLRPHVAGARLPQNTRAACGLILLGGGPYGALGPPQLPGRDVAVRLARDAFERGKPVIGIGLGAQLLAIAAGGSAESAPLRFTVGRATRTDDTALNGLLPPDYPLVVYMRDRPQPPSYARILARDEAGESALFQVGPHGLGFSGHPGIKSAMVEDLIMEFDDAPADTATGLAKLRGLQSQIEDALVGIMAGVLASAGIAAPEVTRDA
ncbi:MAG: gamma-glutamyl-gamma-aminobutyrate hydrolase family protein [Burkholderiales bacterium]|nr:gamma-glutamyl-gamma-aminobutyrate hydrolase family protein [Burkholderiales bacterium]